MYKQVLKGIKILKDLLINSPIPIRDNLLFADNHFICRFSTSETINKIIFSN